MKKELLMIPGPIEIHPEVMQELNQPIVPHYGEEWTRYYKEVLSRYKKIIGTKEDTFFVVGSGHAAIDAVVGSLLEEGDGVLVLNNGFFGQRVGEIARSHRAQVEELKITWGKAFKVNMVKEILEEKGENLKAIFMVHNETSTGIRNPIPELVKLGREYGLLTFVDAVCSIGAEEYLMDKWGVDLTITAAQKGIGAPPGIAMVSVGERAWEAIENRKKPPVGWYLNLETMRDFATKQSEWQPYGITMPVNNIKALDKALEHIETEGLAERIGRHQKAGEFFRIELRNMGLEPLAEEGEACNAVTVVKNPVGCDSKRIIKAFNDEFDIKIADGLGQCAGKMVRVGHMNLGANKNSLLPVLGAFSEITRG